MNPEKVHGERPTLRKSDGNDLTLRTDMVTYPIVNGRCGGEDIAIQIIPDRHAVMEPTVGPGHAAQTAIPGRLQHEGARSEA